MRAWLSARPVCRVALAVVALYALALQILLAGTLFAGSQDQAHILCAPQAGSSAEAPAKSLPAHAHAACCTAAQDLSAGSPPLLVSMAVVWPLRRAVTIVWRPEVTATPRAPPGSRASPRAPPVV